MAIEAPFSRFRKTNLVIYIVACLGFGGWLAYDGYFNAKFIEKHTTDSGAPDGTLTFNRKAPFVLGAAAVLFGGYLAMVSKRKLVADDRQLAFGPNESIAYDSIEKVDKTYFAGRGYFDITYTTPGGRATRRISSRVYDNLAPVLDHIVARLAPQTEPSSGKDA